MTQLPLAFETRMKKLLGEEEYRKYVDSFNENAVKAFRVNTEKISVEEFEKIAPFAKEHIP